MSYRCTMSRIRWFSGPTILALALFGTACRSESERAEGAVREPGDRTGDRSAQPEGQRQTPAQEGRDHAERLGDKAEQLAREGQELGKEAREQAARVGEKAEQLAERGREVGNEVNSQMNRVGEQTGALKDDKGQGGRDHAAQPAAPRDQGGRDQAAQPAAPKDQGGRDQTAHPAAPRDQAAPRSPQGREAQQNQAGGARERAQQQGNAVASTRDAWTQAAKDDDYQVSFGRDGAVVATKEAKASDKRPSDEELRNAVGGKLAGSDHEAVKKLSVTVRDGVVTLQGSVVSIKEATEAVKEAMKAEGVTKVISHIRPQS
ncbi:BON domain-containing protein [Sorangium sp. So ce388]|uniref:BON domain-containing protein n=1 Tax=Sorangium sp. So ce388 TaxID=3133309 RepID=UPI003F5B92A6